MPVVVLNPERIVVLVAPVYGFAMDVDPPSGGHFIPTTLDGPYSITNITNANPMVVTIGSHPLQVGRMVFIEGVFGTTRANDFWTISAVTATTVTLTRPSTTGANAPYAGGGSMTVVNIADPRPGTVGEGVQERDMIAFNAGTTGGGGGGQDGSVNYAY